MRVFSMVDAMVEIQAGKWHSHMAARNLTHRAIKMSYNPS